MASSADSILPDVYESYPAIAPAKYTGKLDGKVVRRRLSTRAKLSSQTNLALRSS